MARYRTRERYVGDMTHVLSTWPGATDAGPDDHTHQAADGGFYNHRHTEGSEVHTHRVVVEDYDGEAPPEVVERSEEPA